VFGGGGVAELVTLGESMVVFWPEGTGPLRHADRFRRSLAGAESNVAVGVARLGHAARWIGRLGDDEFGRYAWNTLRGEGVDLAWARRDPRAPTGIMFKERLAGGDSRVFYYRHGSAGSRLDADDVDPAALEGARWLHVTGITPALGAGPARAVRRAVALAKAHGVRVSFDPNYRARLWSAEEARPVLLELARQADALLLSEDEGTLLFGVRGADEVVEQALALGCQLVVVKRGAQGAVLAHPEPGAAPRVAPVPPYPVSVVETTGAGDAFAAGFLSGLLEGWPPEEAARLGALCGALACTVAGDWEGLPEREVALRLLQGGTGPLR
jgi:2-dehydro-3-deoxygluconokinase